MTCLLGSVNERLGRGALLASPFVSAAVSSAVRPAFPALLLSVLAQSRRRSDRSPPHPRLAALRAQTDEAEKSRAEQSRSDPAAAVSLTPSRMLDAFLPS